MTDNLTTPAKKQWQKPNFYLLDSNNVNAAGDKTDINFKESTGHVTRIQSGHPVGTFDKNPNATYYIDAFVS